VSWRQVLYGQCVLAAMSLIFGFREALVVDLLRAVHPRAVVLYEVGGAILGFSALAAPIVLAMALAKSEEPARHRWLLMGLSIFLTGYQIFAMAHVVT
jgi:hypothetical protein